MEKTLIILRGCPGSGKSTWAKQWTSGDPTQRVRISFDDLREMFGNYWVPEREGLVIRSARRILELAMESGYDIVIDNTNISGVPKWCQECLDKFPEYHVTENIFDTPLEECIKRDNARKRKVGEEVITRMYNRLWKKD